jgi:DNA-binding transcriptional LysR family regulator
MRWLIPRLGGLQQALGMQRELRLVSAGGSVPFAREGIDLAIRRADFEMGADVLAEPFLEERVGPVCRPEMAQALSLSGPLAGVLLHTASRPGAWKHWSALAGVPLQPEREARFEHFYLSLQAAIAGAGIAIGPLALVADDLASGTLCAPHGFLAAEPAGACPLMAGVTAPASLVVLRQFPPVRAGEGVQRLQRR